MNTDLRELNDAIADAESRADRAFFEEVLHAHFVMVRPSGIVATRAQFLDALRPGDHRVSTDLQVTEFPHRRAVVRCTVVKWAGDEEEPPPDAQRFDNLRLFWRTEDGWRLLTWVNEPVS